MKQSKTTVRAAEFAFECDQTERSSTQRGGRKPNILLYRSQVQAGCPEVEGQEEDDGGILAVDWATRSRKVEVVL